MVITLNRTSSIQAKDSRMDAQEEEKEVAASGSLVPVHVVVDDTEDSDSRGGRPSMYSPELAKEICWEVASGKTISEIAKLPGMPAERTIYEWLNKHKEFSQDYTRARDLQNDRHQDELVMLERLVLTGALPADAFNAVARQRNWRSERMQPKKWGKHIALNHSGEVAVVDRGKILEEARRRVEQARRKRGGSGGGTTA